MDDISIKKGARLRFTVEDDMALLREVVSANPFEETRRWVGVQNAFQEKVAKSFSLRAIKDHLDLLLKKFGDKDDKNIKRTGTEEDYSEYDHLLQQIRDMVRDFKSHPIEPKVVCKLYSKDSIEKGKDMRQKCLEYFKNKNDEDVSKEMPTNVKDDPPSQPLPKKVLSQQVKSPSFVPTPSRQRTKRLKNTALDFLSIRHERENAIKEKELELEERRLTMEEKRLKLEEAKLNHEIDYSKKKLELAALKLKVEQADKKKIYDIVENYHKTLDFLIKKV